MSCTFDKSQVNAAFFRLGEKIKDYLEAFWKSGSFCWWLKALLWLKPRKTKNDQLNETSSTLMHSLTGWLPALPAGYTTQGITFKLHSWPSCVHFPWWYHNVLRPIRVLPGANLSAPKKPLSSIADNKLSLPGDNEPPSAK